MHWPLGLRSQVNMLVLSRKLNESIVIRDNIVITVVEIRGDKVRLGIEAPKEIPVHRREVFDKIKSPEASKTVPTDDASGAT
jgi:carbon storage regulator